MAGEGKKRELEARLDRLGRTAVRAYASNEAEAEAAASSPFSYARLRARLAAEAARREEGEGWLAVLGVVWRAAPAMALVGAGGEPVVFADARSISNDDVLETIISDEGREDVR